MINDFPRVKILVPSLVVPYRSPKLGKAIQIQIRERLIFALRIGLEILVFDLEEE